VIVAFGKGLLVNNHFKRGIVYFLVMTTFTNTTSFTATVTPVQCLASQQAENWRGLAHKVVSSCDCCTASFALLFMTSSCLDHDFPAQNQNIVNLTGLLYIMQDKHYASLFATQKLTYGSTLKVLCAVDLLTHLRFLIASVCVIQLVHGLGCGHEVLL